MTKVRTLLILLAGLCAGMAQAGAWDEFQARCLTPYEDFQPAIISGLPLVRDGYALPDGAVLVLETLPGDGTRACRVDHRDAERSGFISWVATVQATERYRLADEENAQRVVLYSDQWIEPQLHVFSEWESGHGSYRVLETELEALKQQGREPGSQKTYEGGKHA